MSRRGGDHGDDPLAGERLRLWPGLVDVARRNQDPAAGKIEPVVRQPAQLGDARAGEHERADDRAPLATAATARLVPYQSAADLADEDVGDAEVACELDGALVRLPDVGDLVPVERAAEAVELVRRFEQRGDVVRLEERPRGRRGLQVDVAYGGGVAEDVLRIAPTGVL